MASNGASEAFSPDSVLVAMATMRTGEPDKKKAAMEYLNKFQKSVREPSIILAPSRRVLHSES